MLIQGLLGSYFLFLTSTSEKKIIPTAFAYTRERLYEEDEEEEEECSWYGLCIRRRCTLRSGLVHYWAGRYPTSAHPLPSAIAINGPRNVV